MTKTIEFYFDFSSPYGYFASFKIDSMAQGFDRIAVWKPILLGAAFKVTGAQPLADVPLKGEYARHDWDRMGEYMEVPWKLPSRFPVAALAPGRLFYWLADRDSERAKAYAKACFTAYFAEDRDISNPETALDVAAGIGADRAAAEAALQDPAVKERFKKETDDAVAKGVFGSPFIVVDGEGFWGSDRMWMVKKKLQQSKW